MAERSGRLRWPPYYGWVLVVTLAVTETVSYGVLYYAFTVFVTPMQAELGWSRGETAGAFSLALLLSALAGVPAGRWLDRHGARGLMTAGSIAAALLVLAWSAVRDLTVFYLVWAAIGLTMAAVLYDPAFVVVANWFRRLRGRALTVLTFLAGFASVIFIPLAGWLVQVQGWRAALVTLAVILAAVTIPLHALVLRRRPSDLGLLPDGDPPAPAPGAAPAAAGTATTAPTERSATAAEALRDPAFWWLTTAFFLNLLGGGAVSVHLVPYLVGCGESETFAAAAGGLIGLMALPGRLIFTPLGDRIPRSLVTASLFLCQTASLAALLLVPGQAGVFLFVAIFGAGFGAITPARVALTADFWGPAHYGAIAGVIGLFASGARALGPVTAGLGFDRFGGYELVFWALAAVSAGGAVAVLVAERIARRRAWDAPESRPGAATA